ncbi:FABP family protein [Pusillimonas sp. ANT_WB101]|uniref:FABP family protein n=1 Tax=Pusillimonas sp. ANT_WB101 TaxID=2597356 RepID=UPI0011EDA1FD|nr:FABP family protein [Pusillimonas sp. ANT_WB101]KAA0911073.1 FABP family protein [Pusillimonas sp. ANT_WB101]
MGFSTENAPCRKLPRGIVINAGGTVKPDATSFELVAEAGSETFGICQHPFLIENFKVVRYILKLTLNGDGTIPTPITLRDNLEH